MAGILKGSLLHCRLQSSGTSQQIVFCVGLKLGVLCVRFFFAASLFALLPLYSVCGTSMFLILYPSISYKIVKEHELAIVVMQNKPRLLHIPERMGIKLPLV